MFSCAFRLIKECYFDWPLIEIYAVAQCMCWSRIPLWMIGQVLLFLSTFQCLYHHWEVKIDLGGVIFKSESHRFSKKGKVPINLACSLLTYGVLHTTDRWWHMYRELCLTRNEVAGFWTTWWQNEFNATHDVIITLWKWHHSVLSNQIL